MKVLRNSSGIAIIYVTLFLMVLGMLFVALGIDIGWMAYVRTQGQASVDAAALRGAAAIPSYNDSLGSQAKVIQLATGVDSNNTVMNQNSGTAASATTIQVCSGSPDSPACPAAGVPPVVPGTAVQVTRTYPTPLFLTRLINGVDSTNISVSSIAFLGGVGGDTPDLPVVLCGQALGFDFSNPAGSTCVPTPSTFNPNTNDTAGYWNYPATDHINASTCRDYVNNPGNMPYVNTNDIIDTGNGVAASCLQDIDQRFQNCNVATCALPADNDLRKACTVVLPIVDCPSSITPALPVKGFASVCVTAVESTGKDKYISGTLVCNVPAPGSRGGGLFLGTYAERPVLVK